MANTPRRRLLKYIAAVSAAISAPSIVNAATRTPQASEGPFYPTENMRFSDVDNDLVKIAGLVTEAGGEIIYLSGRVLDRQGNPVPSARVEIWQVDTNARYIHTGDTGGEPRDTGFQGIGHDITDAEGKYQFRTIKPVPYPGRTPHIHVKVFAGDVELTTQFYIADHPLNRKDSLYRRMSRKERRAVEMVFTGEPNAERAVVDIVL